jgi:hypothetical protein
VLKALAVTPLRVYSPAGDTTRGSVVIGYSHGTGPMLLGTHAARLAARSTPQIEEVGAYVAVRITGTVASAGVRRQATVYSVPATGGDAVVLCLAASSGAITLQRPDCERVVTTLNIASSSTIGVPISLDRLTAYPRLLRKKLASYENEAHGLRRDLKEAKHSGEEQVLATQLASLYKRAARALTPAPLDPIALPAQRSLRTGLARAAAGYRLLARAAARDGRRAWALGCSRAVLADGNISAALRRVVAR